MLPDLQSLHMPVEKDILYVTIYRMFPGQSLGRHGA